MSDDNNTCGNALFEPGSKSKFSYIGGYDLTLGDLTQTDEKHVVAMGKNTTALSATFKRRKLENLTNRELRYTPISETVTVVTPGEETTGSELSGSYSADYSKTADYRDEQQQGGIEGTGTGSYKSFTNLIRNIFKGDGTGTKEGGFIKYVYHSEKNKDGTPVKFEADKMVVTTKQDAEVHYTFTSQESRDVWIKGYTQTVVPPVNPGPDTPELPPVEDAKPAPPRLPPPRPRCCPWCRMQDLTPLRPGPGSRSRDPGAPGGAGCQADPDRHQRLAGRPDAGRRHGAVCSGILDGAQAQGHVLQVPALNPNPQRPRANAPLTLWAMHHIP